MNHKGTLPLETQRLTLRRFTTDDAEAVYRNWGSSSAVNKFMTWPLHANAAETRELLKSWVKDYENNENYNWAICLKDAPQEPIGAISVVEHNNAVDMVQIGYCVTERHWHQGIVSEALQTVIRFFFTQVGANRVEARHDVNNPHSGGVMQKCGMRYEGTHRQADVNNQGVYDVAYYAILAGDYDR